jgi:hypothetical protein
MCAPEAITKESRSQADNFKKRLFYEEYGSENKGFARSSDETLIWTKKLLWRIGKKECEKQLYAMA